MNRRGFFGVVGGGALGIALVKLGWKKPLLAPGEIRPSDCSQLVVTADLDNGQTFTWVIKNPTKGTIPGPIMKERGVIKDLSFYAYPKEYLWKMALSQRVFKPGDTISLTLT
jgi:hypothetical protein